MSSTLRPGRSAGAPAEKPASRAQIDPRGARFAAAVTTVVLAAALALSPSAVTVLLVAAQAVVFGIGAATGVQRTPYSWAFRTLVRPRIGPPEELEDAAPPRFAQTVGLGFTVLALAGYLLGADLLGAVAVGLALAAALLNAVSGFCLGCEIYLLGKRLSTR